MPVHGDSMIGDGILDGDLGPLPRPRLAVQLMAGLRRCSWDEAHETTLKRVLLVPGESDYPACRQSTLLTDPGGEGRLRVAGIFSGLIRRATAAEFKLVGWKRLQAHWWREIPAISPPGRRGRAASWAADAFDQKGAFSGARLLKFAALLPAGEIVASGRCGATAMRDGFSVGLIDAANSFEPSIEG